MRGQRALNGLRPLQRWEEADGRQLGIVEGERETATVGERTDATAYVHQVVAFKVKARIMKRRVLIGILVNAEQVPSIERSRALHQVVEADEVIRHEVFVDDFVPVLRQDFLDHARTQDRVESDGFTKLRQPRPRNVVVPLRSFGRVESFGGDVEGTYGVHHKGHHGHKGKPMALVSFVSMVVSVFMRSRSYS